MYPVYVLDVNPKICAMNYSDRHVHIMLPRYAIMLITAAKRRAILGSLFKQGKTRTMDMNIDMKLLDNNKKMFNKYDLVSSTNTVHPYLFYINNPWVKWLASNDNNWMWLKRLCYYLNIEYMIRGMLPDGGYYQHQVYNQQSQLVIDAYHHLFDMMLRNTRNEGGLVRAVHVLNNEISNSNRVIMGVHLNLHDDKQTNMFNMNRKNTRDYKAYLAMFSKVTIPRYRQVTPKDYPAKIVASTLSLYRFTVLDCFTGRYMLTTVTENGLRNVPKADRKSLPNKRDIFKAIKMNTLKPAILHPTWRMIVGIELSRSRYDDSSDSDDSDNNDPDIKSAPCIYTEEIKDIHGKRFLNPHNFDPYETTDPVNMTPDQIRTVIRHRLMYLINYRRSSIKASKTGLSLNSLGWSWRDKKIPSWINLSVLKEMDIPVLENIDRNQEIVRRPDVAHDHLAAWYFIDSNFMVNNWMKGLVKTS